MGKEKCECATTKCDVKTCLGDKDCAATFACAVPKCPCGPGNMPCVKKCVSAAPSAVTNATLGCFLSKCPGSSPLGSSFVSDSCDKSACKEKCECATTKCDVKTCLGDKDCAATFACAVPKCPCGPGNLPCVKKCISSAPSAVTNATLGCFLSKCPGSSPLGSSFVSDSCDKSACKENCECETTKCDVKTCLGDK